MTLYLASIVEGETETECVEPLLQRIWRELLSAPIRLQVLHPLTLDRGRAVSTTKTDLADKIDEACLELLWRVRRDPIGKGLLLIMFDADKDCPAELGTRLLTAARTHRADVDIVCVLPKKTFENWIVAGASTLAGVNGLPNPLPACDQYEDRSGAAWLDDQLRSVKQNRAYKKTIDAQVLVRRMNLQECRTNAPSFDKLCRDLEARLPPPPADVPAPGG
jgi:hypothetical protein